MTDPASAREKFHALRRQFIGGSEARIIMGDDEAALVRLWREKRGEVEPEDLSANLVVQLGRRHRGSQSALVRGQYRAGDHRCPTADSSPGDPLDGAPPSMAVSREAAPCSRPNSCCRGRSQKKRPREKYMPQLQHNMWVVAARTAVAFRDHWRRQMG